MKKKRIHHLLLTNTLSFQTACEAERNFFKSQPYVHYVDLCTARRIAIVYESNDDARFASHTQHTQCSLSRPTLARRNHKRLHSGSTRREKRDFIRASSEYPILHTRRGRKDLIGTDGYEKKRKSTRFPRGHHPLSDLYTWAQKKTTSPQWRSRIR